MRTRPGRNESEIYFRIVQVARPDRDGSAAYREQTVDITFGPKGAFGKGNIAMLTRRIRADRVVVRTARQSRCKSKSTKTPKTPKVLELLRKANEWQRQIDTGEVRSQAEIARREGITRARVTQVMGMLRLAPTIREHILALPYVHTKSSVIERSVRLLRTVADPSDQLGEFLKVIT